MSLYHHNLRKHLACFRFQTRDVSSEPRVEQQEEEEKKRKSDEDDKEEEKEERKFTNSPARMQFITILFCFV